jgi:hypothetical protein
LISDGLHDLARFWEQRTWYVGFPGDGSGAFEAPIFGVVLFNIFAVSSTRRKSDIRICRERTAREIPGYAVKRGGRPRNVNVREFFADIFYCSRWAASEGAAEEHSAPSLHAVDWDAAAFSDLRRECCA